MEHRYTVPVAETGWHIPDVGATVAFDWQYDAGRQRMLNLCQKGKDKQWDSVHRIDWDHELDPTDQGLLPDEVVPIYGSATWDRLSRTEKDRARHHYLAWTNSQFLHGEQGALVCSAKIVATVPQLDSKFYAATQTMDEARQGDQRLRDAGRSSPQRVRPAGVEGRLRRIIGAGTRRTRGVRRRGVLPPP